MRYEQFLRAKAITSVPAGFEPRDTNPMLFDFQSAITKLSLRRGRSAIFEDCGLGKGPQQLEWGKQVAEHTQGRVIGFAPLAVSQQFAREASKFGYQVNICATGSDVREGINITNYEKLSHFESLKFDGLFIDESSCLKGFDGKFRKRITDFAQAIPYRLAATATPAPNDYMELGNHAEFLGVMSLSEMLATFFVHDGGDTSKWRLKGHAEEAFWKWVASWAICIRKPSDLGYEDRGFELPPLRMHQHTVACEATSGFLFPIEGNTLQERGSARRESIAERVKMCADLVNASSAQFLVWCNLNAEGNALESAISGAVQVEGSDSPEFKEKSFLDFIDGKIRVLVSKPRIAGFGLNLQNCHNMAFVGLSDSYEQFYQAVRRCWRFGQTSPVDCHVICAETEGSVVRNIQRKERQAMEMFEGMVAHMREITTEEVRGTNRERDVYRPETKLSIPSWMEGAA